MREISVVNFANGDLVDCEAIFEGEKLLGAFFQNDASWRKEYFDSILEQLGIKVSYHQGTPGERKLVARSFGF